MQSTAVPAETEPPPAASFGLPRRTRLIALGGIVGVALVLRVLAMVAWRDRDLPDDAPMVLDQAQAMELAVREPFQIKPSEFATDEEAKAEQVQRFKTRLASWFYMHRKPPLFSGLVGLATAACNSILDKPLDPSLPLDTPRVRVSRVEAASWLALAAGLWMLLPAWKLLRRAFDERTALIGLAIVACLPAAVEYSARPLADTLYAGLFLLSAYLLLVGVLDRNYDRMLTAGLVAGLAFLTRSEGLLLVAVAAVFVVIGLVRKHLTPKFAGAGAGLFVLGTAALAGPYIALISHDEGRFTIRRNAGNLLRYDAGRSEVKTAAGAAQRIGEVEAARQNAGRILVLWPGRFLKNIYDESSQMLGYVGMLLAVAGVAATRRKLIRWNAMPLCVLGYLLFVAMLSVFAPHGQVLLSPLLLLTPLMALGTAALAEAIVKWNPARLARPEQAMPWIACSCVALLAVASVVMIVRDA